MQRAQRWMRPSHALKQAALRATIRGADKGAFQNIAPTGKVVAVSALDIVRIENGRFIEHWASPTSLICCNS